MEEEFNKAAEDIKKYNPPNAQKLELYGLYKQAKFGNCNTSRPGWLDTSVNRCKWDKWNSFKGMKKEEAMRKYVRIVNKYRK